ncbi:LysR family transcriptional regulator [Allosediminivita pacifica]|uniref:LysR family transcriptional regulator n=1 Tax=Allosediminivita pacifica TaxID=1267769 RepID=UPI001304E1C0|nr:LysR family transcriptional regulator [Allosediminivita pacifica]
MNVRYLEIFNAVMQTGSTLAAAELLRISQPAVSNQLRQLESQVGLQLFDRRKRRLVPTEEAQLLYERSQNIFSQLQHLDAFSEQLRRRDTGRLNFVCSPSMTSGCVPRAIHRFHEDKPKVTLKIDMPSNERIVSMIVGEMTEFGLTITPLEHPSIQSRVLAKLPLFCVMPNNDAMTAQTSVRPSDLVGCKLISYPRHSEVGRIVGAALPEAERNAAPFAEVRYTSMALRMAEATGAIALVDADTALSANPALVTVRPFETDQFLPLVATHLKDRKLSLIAESFIEDYVRAAHAET